MNRIETNFNLGFDLVLEDFRFQDAAVRLAFADLTKALGHSGPVILWGCNVSYAGTMATVTEGAIFYNNEIWHVYAHTFQVPSPDPGDPSWCFVISNDPEGAKLDSELNPHQTYEVRKAVGARISLPYPADTVNFSQVTRIENKITTTPVQLAQNIISMGQSAVISSQGLAFFELRAQADFNGADSILFATLPMGLRPTSTIRGACILRAATSTAKKVAAWLLNSSGEFYVETLSDESANFNVYLTTEQFRIS